MRQRRTKAELDPTLLERVLAVVAVGAGKKAACQQAGISEETLRQYERFGREAWDRLETVLEEGGSADDLTARDRIFSDFWLRLQRAESNNRVFLLSLVKRAAGEAGPDGRPVIGDWRAGAWLLEKLYPADFGAKLDVAATHSGEVRTGPPVDLSKLTMEELVELRRLREKIAAPDAEPSD